MKVRKLIEILEKVDPEAEIFIESEASGPFEFVIVGMFNKDIVKRPLCKEPDEVE